MGCIVNNHFKVLYGHLKLLSVRSRFFGLLETFEVLASSMPVLPAIQTALLLRGAATVSQILQASCLGISSVFVCACLLKLKSLVLFGAHWKNFGNTFSNVSTACLCSTQLINSHFWGVGIAMVSILFCIYLHHPFRLANYLKNGLWGVSKGKELFGLFIWLRTF